MQLPATSRRLQQEVLQVGGMRGCLVIRGRVHQYLVEAARRVPFLRQVEKVGVGLLNGVTTLEGFDILLEFLPANRDAATPARLRVQRLRVSPGAPIDRLLRLLREHLQRGEDVQLVFFDLLINAEPLEIQSLRLREVMLRPLLLEDLHVVHLLVALGDWILFTVHAAAIGSGMCLGRSGVLLLLVVVV